MNMKYLLACGVAVVSIGTAMADPKPTVFPHGIAGSSNVMTSAGAVQGTLSDTVAKAQGSVQQTDANRPKGYVQPDSNGAVTLPVSGDTSASTATALNATNSRALSSHLGDFVNVRDYGAKLDGSTDDSAAFSYAKDQAVDGQNIVVPPGTTSTVNLPTIPQGTAGKTNIWWLFGRTLPGGSPLYTFGTDTVFSSIGGGLWLHRDDNTPDDGAVFRTDAAYSHDGVSGSATEQNCNVGSVAFSGAGVWCHKTVMYTSATKGDQIADSASAFRTSPSSQIWARYSEATDKTGLSSDKGGSIVGHEEDIYANDRDPNGTRIVQQNMIAKFLADGYAARVGTGNVWGRNDAASYYGTVIRIAAPWDTAGIDLSDAGPLVVLSTVTQGADAGATVVTLDTTHNGIEVGQSVSGNGVADGTTVTSLTDTTVTLSTGLTSAVTVGDSLRFATDAPAIRLGNEQYISYLGDNSIRTYGSAASHSLSTQIDGVVRFSYGTHGDMYSYGDGVANALTLHGQYVSGFDFSGVDFAGSAILMKSGQDIAWELSRTVHTSFADNKLTDNMGTGVYRSLDTGGNEVLSGTHNALGGYVLPSMTTAQIKAMTNAVNALVVYDTDTHTPVIHVDGVWNKINLGDAL